MSEMIFCSHCLTNIQMYVVLVNDYSGDKGACYRYSTYAISEKDAIEKAMSLPELSSIEKKYFRSFIPSDPSSYNHHQLKYYEGDCRL